jgi:hypothetical protein
MRRPALAAGLALLCLTSTTACRTDAARSEAFITRDGRVVLQPVPAEKGETILRVENDDDARHRVVLVRLEPGTDPAHLPLGDDGVLPVGRPSDTEYAGQGYQVVEKLDTMRAFYGGDRRIRTIVHTYLDAGSYVLLSNLPGDYAKGVWATFTIGAPS